ncbi:hypothetical protein MMC18_001056 [Xylographa bjoerkii]|nr:hypothetical protein [Xylographa bjoerkii]
MKANYGRKRKNLASIFSTFQDSHHLAKVKSGRPASKERKPSIEQHAQRMTSSSSKTYSTDHARLNPDGENSIDELADALLEDNTTKAQIPSTRHDVSPSVFLSASGMKLSEILNKPLPRIPTDQSLETFLETPENLYDNVVKALELSTVNLITVANTDSKPESESSHPIHQSFCTSSGNTDALSSLGKCEPEYLGHGVDTSYAFPSTADAAHLSNKRSSLMKTANVEDQKVRTPQPLVKHREAKHLLKIPRLQKSREVFARAKRAISERLSSSVSSKEDLRWDKTNHGRNAALSPSPAEAVNKKYRIDDNDANLQSLNRRLAEGANLSNPKIKALIGDGLVIRKPLPVHDGIQSPGYWSDSLDDPFSDEQLSSHGTPSPDLVESDLNNSGRKTRRAQRTSIHEPLLSSPQLVVPINNLSLHGSPYVRQLSDQLSGLRQHPDVGFFSSSPVGFSTPRFRLEPEINASGKKRLSVVPAAEPSLLDLNFDGLSEDEISEPPKLKLNKSDLNLKRKNTKVDKGGEPTPAAKKAKTEQMQLASNLAMLNRSSGGPLIVRDQNQRLGRIAVPKGTGRGLHIFQVPKGKERSTSVGSIRSVKAGPNAKRSSIPVSFKSAKSRQSRSSTPALVGPLQDDTVSSDELQME